MNENNKRLKKVERQAKLKDLIENNPAATDKELALKLGVSVSTVRLDRALIGVPELRERLRSVVNNVGNAGNKFFNIDTDKQAVLFLKAVKEMASRLNDLIDDFINYELKIPEQEKNYECTKNYAGT